MKAAQVDYDPGNSHRGISQKSTAGVKPDPPNIDDKLDDIGQAELGSPPLAVNEVHRDFPDDRLVQHSLVEQGDLKGIALDLEAAEVDPLQQRAADSPEAGGAILDPVESGQITGEDVAPAGNGLAQPAPILRECCPRGRSGCR